MPRIIKERNEFSNGILTKIIPVIWYISASHHLLNIIIKTFFFFRMETEKLFERIKQESFMKFSRLIPLYLFFLFLILYLVFPIPGCTLCMFSILEMWPEISEMIRKIESVSYKIYFLETSYFSSISALFWKITLLSRPYCKEYVHYLCKKTITRLISILCLL